MLLPSLEWSRVTSSGTVTCIVWVLSRSNHLSAPHVPMENLYASAKRKGVDTFHDDERRLPVRPQVLVSNDGRHVSRRKGKAVEDLGSGFTKRGAYGDKGKAKSNGKRPQITAPQVHDIVDSEDELDMLSSSQADSCSDTGALTRKKLEGKHGRVKQTTSDLLKNMKFNKNKLATDDAHTPTLSDDFRLAVLKEHGANREQLAETLGGSTTPQRTTDQRSIERARSPVSRSIYNQNLSSSRHVPSARSHKPTQNSTVKNTRSTPRPLRRVVSTQHKGRPFPDINDPYNHDTHSPAHRNTVSEPRPFPLSLRESENVNPTKMRRSPPVEKLAPAAFPQLSPVISPVRPPEEFASLTLLGSQEKRRTAKKPFNRDPNKRGTVTQMLPATPKAATRENAKDTSAFPALSPLSLAIRANKMPGKSKLTKKYPCESKDHDGDIKGLQISSDQPKAQPFPMSTQVLKSIRSSNIPPTAGRSRPGKRSSSDGSDHEQKMKRTRQDKENGDM